jgi:hypothetical protein
MKRFLWLFVIVVLFLICTGCGDTFRPVIIPNPPKFPDPRASHSVVAISDNNTDISKDPQQSDRGSIMSVDVSGDTVAGVADVGLAPVHAVQQTASQVLVVNHSVTGAIGDSLTKIAFFGTQISGNPTTISLPPDSAPNFVASTESGTAYVILTNPPSLAVISTTSNALVTTLPLGNKPVAAVETADAKKLYVANNGSSTISAFNTIDRSPRNSSPIVLSSPPVWLAARSDSQRVFVLESNGTLAVLDTTSTAGPDSVIETAISVPGALSMLYDGHLNRLYIPGGSQLAVVDVSPSVPQLLKSVPIPQIPGLPDAVDAVAVAVAALPDGSRAYVASVGPPQPSQVSISAVQGDGATATYTYTLTGGHDLTRGIIVTVSGIGTPAGFDGTFTIKTVSGTSCDQPAQVCTFTAANPTIQAQASVAGLASSIIDNLFPQVTVINTSGNTVKTTAGIAGFPDATVLGSPYFVPICALTDTKRFRFMMAAGGDSSRVYLASCDGGNIDVINTETDTYLLNLPAPGSSRAPIPPSNQPPPQNPVFMIAGP